jgi:hypothetical protein
MDPDLDPDLDPVGVGGVARTNVIIIIVQRCDTIKKEFIRKKVC